MAEAEGYVAAGVKEIILLGPERELLRARPVRLAPLRRPCSMRSTPRASSACASRRAIRRTLPTGSSSRFGTLRSLMPALHLPVQSGSDAVLAAMNRRYTRAHYLDLVRKLRAACPGIALSTDVIVGFPGETAKDFEDTFRLVDEVGYHQVFTFIYSKREGTPAAKIEDSTPREVRPGALRPPRRPRADARVRGEPGRPGLCTVDVLGGGRVASATAGCLRARAPRTRPCTPRVPERIDGRGARRHLSCPCASTRRGRGTSRARSCRRPLSRAGAGVCGLTAVGVHRRAHGVGQDRPRPGRRAGARRRGGERRFHAGVPGHGHRHGQDPARRGRLVPHHGLDLVDPGRAVLGGAVPTLRARSLPRDRPRAVMRSRAVPAARASYVRAAIDAYEFPAGRAGGQPRAGAAQRASPSEQGGRRRCGSCCASADPASAAIVPAADVKRVARAFELLDGGQLLR